jgi:potassium efflux system protein
MPQLLSVHANFEKTAPSSMMMRPRSTLVICWLLCMVFVSVSTATWGAVNPLSALGKKKPDAQAQTPAAATITDENIDESQAKLESRLTELHLQLLPEAVAAMRSTYQGAASPQELEEWEKLANRLAGILDSHINVLIKLKNIRQVNRDQTLRIKSWRGFPDKPPYPLSLLDNLSDVIHAKLINLQSLDMMGTTFEGEFEEFSNGLKNSRKQVRLAEENVEKSVGKPAEQRSRWLLVMARLRDEVNQDGVVFAEARRLMLQESREGLQSEIDFSRQKLAVALKNYRFSADELEQKLKDIDDRREQLQQEMSRAEHDGENARKALQASEQAVRRAQDEFASRGMSKVPLDRLTKEHQLQQILFDAAEFRTTILRGMLYLLKNEKGIWLERYTIANGEKAKRDQGELRRNQDDLANYARWKEFISAKRTSLQLLIQSQQEKLNAISLSGSEREVAQSILKAYQAQLGVLHRGDAVLDQYAQVARHRDEEAKRALKELTLADRARETLDSVSAAAGKIWHAELYVAEETIIADGKKIVRPRSVTLGKLVEAVLILVAGSWVIQRQKKFFHWMATNRLKFSANEAHLYSRLFGYLLYIVLLVGALIFVKIPLAVFAFFGGALAIGIGFGAQTLINNFISGMILLFDRTIRVGDVVEVDGHRGRVATIGMRSSSVKRFDGVEILVPNSLFLQQNVTNWTSSDKRVRYSVSLGVAYGSPTQEAQRVILKAVEDQREVLRDPPAYVVFENFADSSLNFTAYFWINLDPEINSLVVFSDIRHRIGERLAEAGIAIPFPQRDLHLDAGQPIEIKMVTTGE